MNSLKIIGILIPPLNSIQMNPATYNVKENDKEFVLELS